MKDFTYSSTTLHKIEKCKNGSLEVSATVNDAYRTLSYRINVPVSELEILSKPDFRLKGDKELLCLIVKEIIKEKAYSKIKSF